MEESTAPAPEEVPGGVTLEQTAGQVHVIMETVAQAGALLTQAGELLSSLEPVLVEEPAPEEPEAE